MEIYSLFFKKKTQVGLTIYEALLCALFDKNLKLNRNSLSLDSSKSIILLDFYVLWKNVRVCKGKWVMAGCTQRPLKYVTVNKHHDFTMEGINQIPHAKLLLFPNVNVKSITNIYTNDHKCKKLFSCLNQFL